MSDKPKDPNDAAKEAAGPGATATPAAPVVEEQTVEPVDMAASDNPYERAVAAAIGLVSPVGGESYVGVSPNTEQDPEAKGPDGTKIGKFTFKTLHEIPFDRGYFVKDPASKEFYHPSEECTSWADCNLDGALLIPAATVPPITRSKKKAGETDAEFKDRQEKEAKDREAKEKEAKR